MQELQKRLKELETENFQLKSRANTSEQELLNLKNNHASTDIKNSDLSRTNKALEDQVYEYKSQLSQVEKERYDLRI